MSQACITSSTGVFSYVMQLSALASSADIRSALYTGVYRSIPVDMVPHMGRTGRVIGGSADWARGCLRVIDGPADWARRCLRVIGGSADWARGCLRGIGGCGSAQVNGLCTAVVAPAAEMEEESTEDASAGDKGFGRFGGKGGDAAPPVSALQRSRSPIDRILAERDEAKAEAESAAPP
eukprot:1195986-Prorocentrum_minimum.AAC.5